MGVRRRACERRAVRAARPLQQGAAVGLAPDLEPRDGGVARARVRAQACGLDRDRDAGARARAARLSESSPTRAETRCFASQGFVILDCVRGVIAPIKADFGCLLVPGLFLIIMASTVIFATILTPPAHNPFV